MTQLDGANQLQTCKGVETTNQHMVHRHREKNRGRDRDRQTNTHTHTSRYTNKQTNTHTHTHKQTHTHRVPQQARTWNVERLALLHVAADRRRLRNQRVLVQISIVEVHLPNVGLEKWRNGEMEREKQRRIRLSL